MFVVCRVMPLRKCRCQWPMDDRCVAAASGLELVVPLRGACRAGCRGLYQCRGTSVSVGEDVDGEAGVARHQVGFGGERHRAAVRAHRRAEARQ